MEFHVDTKVYPTHYPLIGYKVYLPGLWWLFILFLINNVHYVIAAGLAHSTLPQV